MQACGLDKIQHLYNLLLVRTLSCTQWVSGADVEPGLDLETMMPYSCHGREFDKM